MFKEDPFILELRLKLNPLFNKPMSFFFAKLEEGNTWPEEFTRELNFEEPFHTNFGFNQPRIDAKYTWYSYVHDLIQNGNLIELLDEPASFSFTLDGSEFETPSTKNKFHFNIPLQKTLEIPSLEQLIVDKCEFELITHHPLTKTAKMIDLKQTDINLKVSASYHLNTGYYDCTLFKSKHEQLENIIMAGDYLSTFENSIEREAVLGCYPYDVKKIEARNSKTWEIHNMLLLEPDKIEWDDDRRLLARLIYQRANLAFFRKRMKSLFNWEDIPGEGNVHIRDFLKEDFRRKEHFAYLVYDNEDDIEKALIAKSDDGSAINITSKGNKMLTLKASPELSQVKVIINNNHGKDIVLYYFFAPPPRENSDNLQVFLDDTLNAAQDNRRIIMIIDPLIFNRPKPTHDDGYLIYNAYMNIIAWYVSFKGFNSVPEWVNNIFVIIDRMIQTNPNDDDYFRWKAHAFELIAEVELGQNKITAATQHLAKSIEELQSLYKKYPNKARLEELIQSLENRLKLVETMDNQVWTPVELWKNELLKLKEKKKKTEDFMTRSEIKLYNLDVAEKMADNLQIADGLGELTGKKLMYIHVIPKEGFDYNNWEYMNNVMERNGFRWIKILGENKNALGNSSQNKYWEKWINRKNSITQPEGLDFEKPMP